MDAWRLLLYAMAALLALQSLVALMANHQRQFTRKLIAQEEAKRKAEATQAKPKKENEEEQDGQAGPVAA